MQNMSGGKTALGLDANVGGGLAYINICVPIGLIMSIIILVTEKTNRIVRFHALQSLLLLAVTVVLSLAVGIFAGLVGAITGSATLTGLISMLYWLLVLIYVVISVIAAVKAFQNSQFNIPGIAGLAEKWAG